MAILNNVVSSIVVILTLRSDVCIVTAKSCVASLKVAIHHQIISHSSIILSAKIIGSRSFRTNHQRITTGKDAVVAVSPVQDVSPRSPQGCGSAIDDDRIGRVVQRRQGNHRQLQHFHAVAARRVRDRMRVFARLRERVAVPNVAVAGSSSQMNRVGLQNDTHRNGVVRGVAFGLQTAVLGNADVVAVHRDHKRVKAVGSAEGAHRQPDFALRAAIDRQALIYRNCADGVAAVGVGEDGDGVRCVEDVVTCVAVREGERKGIAYRLRGRRWLHSDIGHGVERPPVPVDGGGLLQEVVEWPPHHALGVSEHRCIVEKVLRYGQVLVHVSNIVHILVPYLAGRRPRDSSGLEDIKMPNMRVGITTAGNNYFGSTILIHVTHNGILQGRTTTASIRSHIVWLCHSFARLMMHHTTINDAQMVFVSVNQFRITILVKIEQRQTRGT